MLLASIILSYAQRLDTHTYPVTENGEQLRNIFLRSALLNSGNTVFINDVAGGESRGFVEKNGKLYFANRTSNTNPGHIAQIFEVDGATGALLKTYDLPKAAYDGLTFSANDIAIDDAGNIFISNMVTTSGEFRVTYINPTQSPIEWKTLLNTTVNGRFETFAVSGDLKNGNGFILVPKSSSNIVHRYNVTGGVANPTAEEITLSALFPEPAATAVTGFGQSARIQIISSSRFYLDGAFRNPTLYDLSGKPVDGFQNNMELAPTNITPKPNNADDKRGGPTGVTEFTLNGKHYLIVASANTDFVTPQQFDLFQFKDDNKSFSDMTFMYRFPDAGMGRTSNGIASVSNVQIVNDGAEDKARIYIYAFRNGYGIYDFVTNVVEEPSSEYEWLVAPAIFFDGDATAKVVGAGSTNFVKFFVNNNEVELTNGMADLSAFSGAISLKATTANGDQVIRLQIRK